MMRRAFAMLLLVACHKRVPTSADAGSTPVVVTAVDAGAPATAASVAATATAPEPEPPPPPTAADTAPVVSAPVVTTPLASHAAPPASAARKPPAAAKAGSKCKATEVDIGDGSCYKACSKDADCAKPMKCMNMLVENPNGGTSTAMTCQKW